MVKKRRKPLTPENYAKDLVYVVTVQNARIPRTAYERGIDHKINALKVYGIYELFIPSVRDKNGKTIATRGVSVEKADPARLNEVYFSTYHNAQKRLAEVNDGIRAFPKAIRVEELIGLEMDLPRDQNIDARERTSIALDSLTQDELLALSRKYNQETLGAFYRDPVTHIKVA